MSPLAPSLLLVLIYGVAISHGLPSRLVKRNVTTDGLPDSTITAIRGLLNTTATQSWEMGTHLQALTEYDYAAFAPYSKGFMPPPSSPVPSSVLDLAAEIVRNKSTDAMQLMPDGSAADPASCAVAVSLANATGQVVQQVTSAMFADAATDQLEYLLTKVPRTSDGAISHRNDQVQLWSDFVYMVPPFLAYYGVMIGNESVIQASYDQIRLYRQYLRQPNGLWAHIVLGSNTDTGLWATGNAWAAAGMMRVYATIVNSDYADQFKNQTTDIADWTVDLVENAFSIVSTDGLFHNYMNDTRTFLDAASTTLMTSVAYRLDQMSVSSSTVASAERARILISSSHVDPNTGVLSPVVDPLSFGQQGSLSPEGEAFVLIMESAWRDWKDNGGKASSTSNSAAPASRAFNVVLLAVSTLWMITFAV